MAVYAALFPLKSKIRGYLKHYDACFDPPSLELTQHLYKEVVSFQEFVGRLDSRSRERLKASLAQIAVAIPKFRDLLSLHLSEQYDKVPEQRKRRLLLLGQPPDDDQGSDPISRLIDLTHLKRDVDSLIQTFKKVKEEHEEEEDFCANKAKMVGLSDLQTELKEELKLAATIEYLVGSRVLFITRMQGVVERAGLESGIDSLDMRLMDKDESWDLLLDDCDLMVEKQIKEAKWGKGMLALDFTIHYSWNDGKLKS
ncbi:putative late blight resistance protein R1B-16 [Salvia divinorum]|uniref:Late blight resistance protein R1B-16 n=1 Tax=Salvia divinorum TaxID=28513 RepID=A0ABD1HCQ3_SALDI